MTTLKADLQKAINEHLPNLVGEELKKLINEHEQLKNSNDVLTAANKMLQEQVSKLSHLEGREFAIADREGMLSDENQKIALREAVLKVKEECNDKHLQSMQVLTSTVFQSNRFSYGVNLNRGGNETGPVGPNGSHGTIQTSEFITGSITQNV